MWSGVGGVGVGWLSGGWNWLVGVCGCSKWVEMGGLVIGLIEADLEGFENCEPPPFG